MERLSSGVAEVTGLAARSSLVRVQRRAVDKESNRRGALRGDQTPDSCDCLFLD